uniref:RNase H type-1 domain-containing protein n=1 Tax=Cannabis sativa TaxID=3483 RepID=A0A803Q5Z4_CANSA
MVILFVVLQTRDYLESTGNYSVKSSYKLASILEEHQPSVSTLSTTQWWNKFWGLSIPSKVFEEWTSLQLEQFACILWGIWTERNKERHGSMPIPFDVLLFFAMSSLAEFYAAKFSSKKECTTASSSSRATQSTPHWMNPLLGRLKLNTDVVINSMTHTSGFGAVLRNYSGKIIAAMAKPFPGSFRSKVMEAMTLMYSLQWIKDL